MTSHPYFDPAHSAEIVASRAGPHANPRLREIMDIFVRHMHEAVKESGLTQEEWNQGIAFLTHTGQMCTDWRQEFILLSDVLGISMLVDAINHGRPAKATENTVLGPFHVADAPHYPNGAQILLDQQGEPMIVRGRVLDVDGGPIAGATLGVWQANADGFYDVQQKGVQPEGNLRGIFTTDADGSFWFRSAKPRWYPIPHDGPVGRLLQGLDRNPFRPAHIHFIVEAPGFERVVTHIFASDCPFLGEDAVFGVKQSLVADFRRKDDPAIADTLGVPNPFWEVEHDFILVKDRM